MKSSLLLCIFLIVCQLTYSQDFITKWNYDAATSEIKFSALTTDTVHYTWTAIPSGNSGNGSFIQTTPDPLTLNGLNALPGDTITLNMKSDNLSRFYFENRQDQRSLIDVSQWGNVSWTSMHNTFNGARNLIITATDIPDLSNVTDMSLMFFGASKFNQDISGWEVSNVTDMSGMFQHARDFNQDIGDWDVSNVTDMRLMFYNASLFNQDIGGWDVSNVSDMYAMFRATEAFNQNIGAWEVSNVSGMRGMFSGANSFNQDISGWDVSNVIDMGGMFYSAYSFNQDISGWDVSNVTDMGGMFANAQSFNQNIGDWDVSNVSDMYAMFSGSEAFNQNIGAWDVSSVNNLERIFEGAFAFNQDLGDWKLHPEVYMRAMLDSSGLDCDHYSATLVGWQKNNPTVTGVRLGADGLYYGTSATAARDSLINDQGWTITGDEASGMDCNVVIEENKNFITHWTFSDSSTQLQFSALTTDTVHYTWTASPSGNSGDGSFIQTTPDSVTLIGLNIMPRDTITLNMASDNLSQFYFEIGQDQKSLLEVFQWGDVQWTSMHRTFYGASNLGITATDIPDLSNVTDMSLMFFDASAFNGDIDAWDVSNTTDMRSIFSGASSFNQDIGGWDVSNVTDMSGVFAGARVFNQDIGGWDVSKVTDMSAMFRRAISFNADIGGLDVSNLNTTWGMFTHSDSFNQDIGVWDVSNATDMGVMFKNAESFNQDISGWDVSNVTNMSGMFYGTRVFNQDIGGWDVSNVTNMSDMFVWARAFNQDIVDWNVSNVTDMSHMFHSAKSFNQDIGGWDVSNVVDMMHMFSGSEVLFNQDIGGWDVSNVANMHHMFSNNTVFNQDIRGWDVSIVTNMWAIFRDAKSFNQDIGDWKLHPNVRMHEMLDDSGMDCDHYSATLVGWQKNNSSVSDVFLGASGLKYGTSAEAARNALINDQGWTIHGDIASGLDCDELVSIDFAASDHRLTIYPNPASDQIIIKGDQFEVRDIRVFNVMGQNVTDQIIVQQQSPTHTTIEFSNLVAGMYFIKSSNGSGMVFKK